MSCDNVPTTAEIGQVKKDVNDFNTFMTSTSDTFVDSAGVSRLTLQGAINKFGFGTADFTFTDGGTLSDRKLLVSNDPVDGFLYRYVGTGTFPITVTAGTDPTIGTDWEAFTATVAEFISNANGGSVQDFIDAQYSTVAELATGKFHVGQYVRLTDRAMGLFLLQSGGTVNGYGIIDAGNGNTAVMQDHFGTVYLEWFGIKTGQDNASALLAVASSGFKKVKSIAGKDTKYETSQPLPLTASILFEDVGIRYIGVQIDKFISADSISARILKSAISGGDKVNKLISLKNCPKSEVSDNELSDVYYDNSLGLTSLAAWTSAIYVTGNCENIKLNRNEIESVNTVWDGVDTEVDTSTARAIAVLVEGGFANGLEAVGNTIKQVTGSSGVGIHLLAGGTAALRNSVDFTITDNKVYGVTNRGYKIQASGGVLSNNHHITGESYLADFLATHSLASIGNFFNARANISIISAEDVVCEGNRCVGKGYQASIILDTCSHGVVVSDNTCDIGTNSTSTTNPNISVINSSGAVAEGNTLKNGARTIYLSNSDNCSVSDNTGYGVRTAMVWCENSATGNAIHDNKLMTGTPTYNVRISDSKDNQVYGNKVMVSGVPAVTISGNTTTWTSENNNLYDNHTVGINGNVVQELNAGVLARNPSWGNKRMNAHVQFNGTPTWGKYDSGDKIFNTNLTAVGNNMLFGVRFGGEYGTGSLPTLVTAAPTS